MNDHSFPLYERQFFLPPPPPKKTKQNKTKKNQTNKQQQKNKTKTNNIGPASKKNAVWVWFTQLNGSWCVKWPVLEPLTDLPLQLLQAFSSLPWLTWMIADFLISAMADSDHRTLQVAGYSSSLRRDERDRLA